MALEPEQQMAALFVGLNRMQRMALLSRLERAEANLYRQFAQDEANAKAREALLKAATDEEGNGALMALMSTPKAACEKCGTALPDPNEGLACSFQCTYCASCADALKMTCPNCSGALAVRSVLAART